MLAECTVLSYTTLEKRKINLLMRTIPIGNIGNGMKRKNAVTELITYFIATPPARDWQHSEGLLLLHSFVSLDIFIEFSILRFGTSAKSVS